MEAITMTKLEALERFVRNLYWIRHEAEGHHEQLAGALINTKGQLVTIHSGLSERNLMRVVDEAYDEIHQHFQALTEFRAMLEEQCEPYDYPQRFEWFKSPREVL
jgi:hypothetical protein